MATRGILVIITLVLGYGSGDPSLSVYPTTRQVQPGKMAELQCIATDIGSNTVRWWFVDHNLQISSNYEILTVDKKKYTINRGSPGVFILRINNVDGNDQGHYKCDVKELPHVVQSVKLSIEGAEMTTPGTMPAMLNVTDCCIKHKVSAKCQPACDPASLDSDRFDASRDCSIFDLPGLLKCGSDGRNHAPCCKRRGVADICLVYCMGRIPDNVTAGHGQCMSRSNDIILCYAEGRAMLPSPPAALIAIPSGPSSITLQWSRPLVNYNTITGYRIFYQKDGDPGYSSVKVGKQNIYSLTNLMAETKYHIHIIAFNSIGSSMPSYTVAVMTGPATNQAGTKGKALLQCCKERGVSSSCQTAVCSGTYTKPNTTQILRCFPDFEKVFTCIAGEKNHTSCCHAQGVPRQCFPLCASEFYSSSSWPAPGCLTFMPKIESCFARGDAIPGPPTSVRVDPVRETSAVLSWAPPTKGSSLVTDYIVRYMEANDPSTKKEVKLGFQSMQYDVARLRPDTLYKISITSVGKLGFSAPSPEITFLTYYRIANPATQIPPTQPPPHNVTACCLNEGVQSKCMPLCRYEANITQMAADDLQRILGCEHDLGKLLACGANGRDHQRCCRANQVEPDCLQFCAFSKEQAANFTFTYSQMKCLLQTEQILQCMKQGIAKLPSEPQSFQMLNVSTNSITLTWLPPAHFPDTIVNYVIDYWQVRERDSLKSVTVTPKSGQRQMYILQNLKDDTVYSAQVLAYNQEGSSVPTPRIAVRTFLDAAAHPKINTTVPANVTDCCVKENVKSSCVRGCDGRSAPDLEKCSSEFGKILKCAAASSGDKQDHIQCCRRRNIPRNCLSFCNGQPKADAYDDLYCLMFTEQILSCFKEGYPRLPSTPESFRIMNVGTHSVDVAWDQPKKNGDNVRYLLYYRKSGTYQGFKVIRVATRTYTVTGLEQATHYDIYLIAVNPYGSSPATPTYTVWTHREGDPIMDVAIEPGSAVGVGDTVTLTCSARAYPAPSVYWIHHAQRFNGSKLVMKDIKKENGGKYTCVAANAKGEVTSHYDVYIKVQFKPEVHAGQKEVKAAPYQSNATLSCVYTGYPAHLMWTKGGIYLPRDPLRPGRFRKITREHPERAERISILNITMVTPEDYGMYTCVGKNSEGQAQDTIILSNPLGFIPSAPPPDTIPGAPHNVTECCVQASVNSMCLPACSFDVDLSALNKLKNRLVCTLELPKILRCGADGRNHTECCRKQPDIPSFCYPACSGVIHSGFFDPRAQECLNHVESIVDCMEEGQKKIPQPPTDLKAYLQDGYMIVTWKPPTKTFDLVSMYEVHYRFSGKGKDRPITVQKYTTRVKISEVPSYSEFEAYVYSVNHHGKSVQSVTVRLTTNRLNPSRPVHLKATILENSFIHLTWEKPLTNPGAVKRYIIYYQAVLPSDGLAPVVIGTDPDMLSYRLINLKRGTTYQIYVTAKALHHESEPSNYITVEIPEDLTPMAHLGGPSSVAVGLGVFFALVAVIAIGVAVYIWHVKFRKNTHSRFKNDSVAFENPGYATNHEGRVSGLPSSSYGYDQPTTINTIQTNHNDSRNSSAIMRAAEETNDHTYPQISTEKKAAPDVAQIDPADTKHVSLKFDGSTSNM